MEHDWKKATLKPAVAAKTVMREIRRGILKGGGGHTLLKAVWHP